ncbi:MAG: 4Fe-4S dicluster domain-containing protein [Oscillospiraceae bacterium]|nr:4Fe-4S dicluster domain-containing protein [Oscillospiraceae bacterium]
MSLPEKKVKELIEKMNSMSTASIPSAKPIVEMFNLAMDEKTLDYLLAIGTDPLTVPQLEHIYHNMYGGDKAEWEKYWNEILMTYSFVHPHSETDRSLYELSPIFPGWVEFTVGGPINEKRAAILNKFMEFWGLLKTLNIGPIRYLTNIKGEKKIERGDAPRISNYVNRGREITLNKPLESEQQVYVSGDVHKLLKKYHDEIAVLNCFCRQYKFINTGETCDFDLPIEGCIVLGALSRQLVDNGVARHLPYEEAVDLLNEFSRKGCVHTTFHHNNDANKDEMVICNCCTDCCLLYEGYQNGGLSKIFTRSYYKPEVIDITRCVGCDVCGKFCPTDATFYDKQKKELVFRYENCIGCGQCVNQCKFDVRQMIPDERDVFVKTKKKSKGK